MQKRILIATGIFPPDIGGPATYTRLILDRLPSDFDVKVVTYGEKQPEDNEKIFRVFRRWPKGLRHLLYFLKVLQLCRGADIIFAQDLVSAGLPAMLAAKILRKKFIVKIVGDYAWEQGFQRFGVQELPDVFQENHYGFLVESLRLIQKFVSKSADYIITPSFYLKKIVSGWGIKENKIKVIYNAVNLPDINYSKEQARKELMLDINSKIILSIGRNVPWKGFEKLADAEDELKKEIPYIKLVIIGQKEKLPREAIFKNLKAADAFVLNTGYEGLSHQILEAMAVGVPIVTTNVGGNPELIQDGKNGLLIQYNNPEELKEAIKKILLNKVDTAKFVLEAHKTISLFTEEKMISELKNLLLSV